MSRTSKKKIEIHPKNSTKNMAANEIATNDHFNIIEILLLDHSYLKDCIEVLKDEDEDKKVKFKYAKGFLDALRKHSLGEKKAIYAPLKSSEDFKSQILESIVEHGIVDTKVKYISTQLTGMRNLTDEMEAELKVLAEIVEHHVEEEEKELLPKMREQIHQSLLNEMGFQFLLLRQFTEKDLEDTPELLEEISTIKSSPSNAVGNILTKTKEYFNSEEVSR